MVFLMGDEIQAGFLEKGFKTFFQQVACDALSVHLHVFAYG